MQVENLVCITSVIYTANTPLSYCNVRSIYSPQQRIEQTLETIKSLREYIPNVFILMIEGSVLNEDEQKLFTDVVDKLIIHNVPEINNKFKNLGEIKQLLKAIEFLEQIRFNNFWKISGRYKLNSSFDYSKFDNSLSQSKHVNDILMSTILIKISSSDIEKFKVICEFSEDYLSQGMCIEEYFRASGLFTNIEHLGVQGNIAIDGTLINI